MRAAQYLRMSTDMQQHSIDVQAGTIAAYAARHDIEIVATYLDAGRSGLTLEGRPQLRRLLDTAQSGRAEFDAVLVYDVSRWGRFQEVDEAAKYEQLCRDAGVKIIYCAEPFEGSTQMVKALMKTVRRVMAAEYSRDISEKTAATHRKIASEGYRTGGRAPYGYQRWSISNGRARLLERGEIRGEPGYTTLRPGPPEAVRAVRRIYQLFVEHGRNRFEIVRILNAEGHAPPEAEHWSHHAVHTILTSETYVGTNVAGAKTQRLGGPVARVPREQWIRVPDAFEGIIDRRRFNRAQAIIAARRPRKTDWTDDEMIEGLAQLKARGGDICVRGIDEDGVLPKARLYLRRFGSMGNAYRLAGVEPHQGWYVTEGRASARQRRSELCTDLGLALHARGHEVRIDRGVLAIDDWFRILFSTSGPRLKAGNVVWEFRRPATPYRLLVAARLMSRDGQAIDFTLVEPSAATSSFRLGPKAPLWRGGQRSDDIDGLAALIERRLSS